MSENTPDALKRAQAYYDWLYSEGSPEESMPEPVSDDECAAFVRHAVTAAKGADYFRARAEMLERAIRDATGSCSCTDCSELRAVLDKPCPESP